MHQQLNLSTNNLKALRNITKKFIYMYQLVKKGLKQIIIINNLQSNIILHINYMKKNNFKF